MNRSTSLRGYMELILMAICSKKYEINEEGRIVALRDGPWGGIGTIGGFVESEDNLSQLNDCWIYDDAKATGFSLVFEFARLYDTASVTGRALVSGNALVRDNARICGDAKVDCWRC